MTTDFGRSRFFIAQLQNKQIEKVNYVLLILHERHHVAIARRAVGASLIWADGKLVLDGQLLSPGPADSRWLTVGSSLDGQGSESQLQGALPDICAFDRILSDEE